MKAFTCSKLPIETLEQYAAILSIEYTTEAYSEPRRTSTMETFSR